MTVFIDSDVFMEVLRGQDDELLTRWHDLGANDAVMLYSPLSAAEIWGVARSHEHARIAQLFRPMLCTPVDSETGKLAGEYLRKFSKNHDLKLADAIIAASAIRHQAALWTHSRNRYPIQELSFYI